MTRFGIFCPPAIGHLNPMAVLASELQRRGHEVIFFGVPDALKKLATLDFGLQEIGVDDYPEGSIDRFYKTLGALTGKAGLKFTIDFIRREMQMLFNEAPAAIRAARIDMLIVDQITAAAGTIADHLDLPFVTVCNAMLINREVGVPPYSTPWSYSDTPLAQVRNRLGNAIADSLTRKLWQDILIQRHRWALSTPKQRDDLYSPLAQLCQLPPSFDFPRKRLPTQFHYIGSFQDPSGQEPIRFPQLAFPFERLDGRPLIYASLGTLQNQRPEIFACIARACAALRVQGVEAQLVISLGNPMAECMELPGNPIVVPFAPHRQVIERSQLVITHAGMNTVLTALGCGVPLVAIPITNEQPGIAARLARTGAGRMIQLGQLDERRLQEAIAAVLTQPSYREQAQRLQADIQQAGGVVRAADVIERVL